MVDKQLMAFALIVKLIIQMLYFLCVLYFHECTIEEKVLLFFATF